MNWFAFIYLLCCAFYFTTSIITLYPPKKDKTNWIFGIVCLNFSLWSMLLFLMSMAETPEMAALYRRLMIICWSTIVTELFYFVIFSSKCRVFYDKIWKNLLLITPGIFCFIYYFFTPVESTNMISIQSGWAFNRPEGRGIFWDYYFTVYYVTFIVLSMIVTIYWYRTTTFERERRQSRLIFLSYLSILILGSLFDTLLPMIGISSFPPVTVILAIIFVVGLNFAVTRYRMMSMMSENSIMEVLMMMSAGLIIIDSQEKILVVNAGAENILGYRESDLVNMKIDDYFSDDSDCISQTRVKLENSTMTMMGNGSSLVHVLMSSHTRFDQFSNKIGTLLAFQDINELKKAEDALTSTNHNLEDKIKLLTRELEKMNEQLKYEIKKNTKRQEKIKKMIYEDSLTKLYNRRFFYEHLKKHISYNIRYNKGFSVLFIDLDGFKLINDSLGHDMGDELLIRVAKKLKLCLKESDVISRAGGDEFLILLHNTFIKEDINVSCKKILSLLEEPITVRTYNLHISASIGISSFPKDGSTSATLIKNADIAMYEAKDQGKGRFVFYEENLKEDIDENMNLTNDLYAAIENNEFELFYQPQVNAMTHEIKGFEALIRWKHPKWGRISPLKFIPLAETTGLIIPIGEWVIQTAVKQQKEWEKLNGRSLRMGVNVSTKQLKGLDFVDRVKKAINNFDINPANLELEITETIFMEDSETILGQLNRLKNIGATIAIDDFGTEYSSLSYLKKLPINRIKIPKTFVDGIGINEKDEVIIVSIIVLAIKLGCTTIAEGVEHINQLHFLQVNGCDEIQGYYFYQPMNAEKIEAMMLTAVNNFPVISL